MSGWHRQSASLFWQNCAVKPGLSLMRVTGAMTDPTSMNLWLTNIFAAKSVRDGGIVRRKLADVDRIVGRDAFIREVEKRGFQAFENAGQVIVFCNDAPVLRLL